MTSIVNQQRNVKGEMTIMSNGLELNVRKHVFLTSVEVSEINRLIEEVWEMEKSEHDADPAGHWPVYAIELTGTLGEMWDQINGAQASKLAKKIMSTG